MIKIMKEREESKTFDVYPKVSYPMEGGGLDETPLPYGKGS